MADIAIKISDLSKYYKLYESPSDRLREALNPFGKKYHRKFYATRNVDLEISKGEILGIVGRNGCGKSTLLKLISGVLTPNKGSVVVNGKISALLELGAGLNPEFTGVQNIFFYGAVLGFSHDEMRHKVHDVISFADIGEYINQPLKTYSSGMKSRLGFALAISTDPDILIVDEVLAVGDILFQKKCYNKIHELFNNGKTVIFVSHSSQAVVQFCSRAILIEDGSIVSDGSPKEIIALYEKKLFSSEAVNAAKMMPCMAINENNSTSEDTQVSKNISKSNSDLADIYDMHICDSENNVVTVLRRHATYYIEFKVKYHQPARQISLGVQIKNMKGLLISGVNQWSYLRQQVSQIQKNDILKARCSFKCLLVPGVYTAALSSMSNATDELVKVNDALIFKVEPDTRVNGGVVGLEQELTVYKIPNGGIHEGV